jgi:hypothetical protein
MATDNLGAFQREYSAAALGRYEVITGSIFLLLILGIGAFALTHTQPGQVWLGVALIGALAGGLGVYIFGGIRKLGRRVLFHTDGMVLRQGGTTDVVLWSDVASLTGMLPVSFRGTPAHVGGPLSIELRDGRRIPLRHGYADMDVLANFLHEKVLAHLLPQAHQALARGETLGMGALQVDRAGLHAEGKSLPWLEVAGVSFTPDDMMILQAGAAQPWATLKIAKTPNANLLLQLMRGAR